MTFYFDLKEVDVENKYSIETFQEWRNLIMDCISRLKKTWTGKILIENLSKHKIEFTRFGLCPKTTFMKKKCIVTIPKIYKSLVTVADKGIIDSVEVEDKFRFYVDITNNIETKKKYKENEEFEKFFSYKQLQPLYLIVAHELIHCLRYFLNKTTIDEEEATIYGILGQTLYIEENKITENQVRLELDLPLRINHEGVYIK